MLLVIIDLYQPVPVLLACCIHWCFGKLVVETIFCLQWMYILPVVILVLLSGASNPEGEGGGR